MAGPLANRNRRNAKTIGGLRQRVTVQRLDESIRNEAGAVVPTWVDVATVWASVEPVGGNEAMTNGQVQVNVTHRVVMRHREDLTAKHRLIWVTSKPANMVLNVDNVAPSVGVANCLEVMCVREETSA